MRGYLSRFFRDEAGATAIEYAIIAGVVSLAIVAAVTKIGTSLSGKFSNVNNGLQ